MQRARAKRPKGAEGRPRKILEGLKLNGPATAGELARLLGGGAVAMRAHLRQLEAMGLIAHDDEHRPVGRPVRRFHVTPASDPLFPKHYDMLAIKLVEALIGEVGETGLDRILTGWELELARVLAPRFNAVGDEDRIKTLVSHQNQLGFMASMGRRARGLAIIEKNCPIARVAALFPSICDHEASFFSRVLGKDVALASCQARGGEACVFEVAPA